MSCLTVLVDMDGPLAAFDQHGYAKCLEMGLVINTPLEKRTARFFTDHMDDPDHVRACRLMIEERGWFRDLPVTEGAQDGIAEMMRRKDLDVWVCSKPLEANPTCRDDKGMWLREHFPKLEDRLILTPDKSMIRGHVLLDDAIKLSWIPRATWEPVVFTEPFNGPGSVWEDYPHWSWGESIDDLIGLFW